MEHPYQTPSPLEHAMRERGFAQNTESHLDDFISQAQHVLENLTDQHGILKVCRNVCLLSEIMRRNAYQPNVANTKTHLGHCKYVGSLTKCYTIY
jgi:hypothetical protein